MIGRLGATALAAATAVGVSAAGAATVQTAVEFRVLASFDPQLAVVDTVVVDSDIDRVDENTDVLVVSSSAQVDDTAASDGLVEALLLAGANIGLSGAPAAGTALSVADAGFTLRTSGTGTEVSFDLTSGQGVGPFNVGMIETTGVPPAVVGGAATLTLFVNDFAGFQQSRSWADGGFVWDLSGLSPFMLPADADTDFLWRLEVSTTLSLDASAAIPLPPTLPLLLRAVALLGWVGRRKAQG